MAQGGGSGMADSAVTPEVPIVDMGWNAIGGCRSGGVPPTAFTPIAINAASAETVANATAVAPPMVARSVFFMHLPPSAFSCTFPTLVELIALPCWAATSRKTTRPTKRRVRRSVTFAQWRRATRQYRQNARASRQWAGVTTILWRKLRQRIPLKNS
jgi:hypothetical protein